MRGLIDRKGELFAYRKGNTLFTLDGEPTGRIEKTVITDLAGNTIWRIIGDAVFEMDGFSEVGYFGGEGESLDLVDR